MTESGTENYRRVREVVRRDFGPTAILVNRRRNTIHHLNPVGAAVWELLIHSVKRDELVETLHLAFPSVDRAVIEKDVDSLLDRLLAAELIAKCEL
jgi:Coenzyme PQQ synthesis protein D (PqqD)